jgi:hypothetical protein
MKREGCRLCSLPFIFLRKERTGNEGTRTDRQNQGAPPSPPQHQRLEDLLGAPISEVVKEKRGDKSG